MSYEALTKACGGVINPDTLTEFQRAMREYREFMSGARAMFAPVGETFARCGSCRTPTNCAANQACYREME